MGTYITKNGISHLHSELGLYECPSAKNGPEPPPKVLTILASVLERSIHRNEKLLKRSRTKDTVTVFHGTRAPTLSIRKYIDRIFEYSSCSPSCFVVAYIYMDRFIQTANAYLTSLNAHRLFIACVLVAVKVLEDECYNNSYFAKIGGISCAEMNRLELKLLTTLNYRLHVSCETFDHYCASLEKEGEAIHMGSSSSQLKRAVQSCGLNRRWLKKDQLPGHVVPIRPTTVYSSKENRIHIKPNSIVDL